VAEGSPELKTVNDGTTNEEVLARARAEIMRSWRETCELNKDHPQAEELFNPANLPAFHDPFAGGGHLLKVFDSAFETAGYDIDPTLSVSVNIAS
jgi:putative DNA methylase